MSTTRFVDLAAEEALLAGILLDSDALRGDVAEVKASDFYNLANRCIFEAALALSEDEIRPDWILIADALEARGMLANAGGRDALESLSHKIPASLNLAHYARIVRDNARMREAFAGLRTDAGAATNPAELAAALIRHAERLQEPAAAASACDPIARLRTSGLTLGELLEVEFPPTAWLVDELIQAEATTCIYGAPGGGKTFLLIECIARALAAGRRVLLCEEEGAAKNLQERLRRVALAHRLNAEQQAGLLVIHGGGLDLTVDGHVRRILGVGREHRAEMIALDSLAAMAGGRDENDSSVQGPLANTIHRLKVQSGAAVVALHHMTKEGWKPGEKPTLRSLRGHSSLPGRLDAAIAVIQDEEATSPRELVFDIYETKRRDDAKSPPRRCWIDMPAAGPEARCKLGEIDQKAARADDGRRKVDDVKGQVLEAIHGAGAGGLTTADVRTMVTGRNEHKAQALRELTSSGKIKRKDGRLVVSGGVRRVPDDAA